MTVSAATIASLPIGVLERQLAGEGIRLVAPPFRFHLRSNVAALAAALHALYSDYTLGDADGFDDFSIHLTRRRPLRPKVFFECDGAQPFEPLPLAQAFPLLEWGMNWCISSHCHRYLISHAAVVERNGCAIVLPAPPGSGKSTLCALLVGHGWRLLSDELALLEPESGLLVPVPRPVSLKNTSIEVIRQRYPALALGSLVHDTIKGTVGHFRPPAASIARAAERARPGYVIFPRYAAGAPTALTPLPRAQALMRLASNTFNYDLLGELAFEALARLIAGAESCEFQYHDAGEALTTFDRLAGVAG